MTDATKKTPPHKSTTVPEKFYHRQFTMENQFPGVMIGGHAERDQFRLVQAVTAFARQDKDGKWYVAHAECDSRDQFCRRAGRLIARRKWFAGKRKPLEGDPTYDNTVGQYEHTYGE